MGVRYKLGDIWELLPLLQLGIGTLGQEVSPPQCWTRGGICFAHPVAPVRRWLGSSRPCLDRTVPGPSSP